MAKTRTIKKKRDDVPRFFIISYYTRRYAKVESVEEKGKNSLLFDQDAWKVE